MRYILLILVFGALNASSLNELVRYATNNSPLVKQAKADLKLADLRRKVAKQQSSVSLI